MNFKIEDKRIPLQLNSFRKKSLKIYFGFPGSGNPYTEIAAELTYGSANKFIYKSSRGNIIEVYGIPARDFLNDGFNFFKKDIEEEIRKYWIQFFDEGVSSPNKIGQKIVNSIKQWILLNPYEASEPNSVRVQIDKGGNFPLFDTGEMLQHIEFVITGEK